MNNVADDFINEKKYIFEKFGYVFKSFDSESNNLCRRLTDDEFNIWFCWFQGIQQSPQIVQKCYNTLINCNDSYNLNVIDFENYQQFVEIPDYIIEKYKKGYISTTHFCDVLRICLLYEYGGLWSDATMYYTDYFSNHKDLLSKDFITLGFYTTFWQGTRLVKSKLYKILRSLFFEYLKIHDKPRIYLLLDAFFQCTVEAIPEIMNMVSISKSDSKSDSYFSNVFYFAKNADREANQQFISVLKNQFVSKLTYKKTISKDTSSILNILLNHNIMKTSDLVLCSSQKTIPENFINFFTARIDLKFHDYTYKIKDTDIITDDEYANVMFPQWLNTSEYKGVSISTIKGKIQIHFEVLKKCNLEIILCSLDIRGKNNVRIPYWITYNSLIIDSKQNIIYPVHTHMDRPFVCFQQLELGPHVLHVEFSPFHFSYQCIRQIPNNFINFGSVVEKC